MPGEVVQQKSGDKLINVVHLTPICIKLFMSCLSLSFSHQLKNGCALVVFKSVFFSFLFSIYLFWVKLPFSSAIWTV